MTSFALLLNELESTRLEVMLVPQRRHTNEGGMIRCAVSRNPAWYSRFCRDNPSSRRRRNNAPDTRIKRRDILRILTRLAAGLPSTSKYVPELTQIAERRAKAA